LQEGPFRSKNPAPFAIITSATLMRFFAFCALFCFSLLAAKAADVAPASAEEKQRLAAEVYAIFDAKCVECHGAELVRPKGKFGYVLDLQRIADNPEYVVRGEPEKSEMYTIVESDEMPGEDANVPPLTPAEKESVRRWVEVGAPALVAAKSDAPPAPPVAAIAVKAPDPLWKQVLRWTGNFHPLSTHFPVALMFVAVLAEALGWITRQESWLQTVRFLVILAALSAVAATGLGWVNAYFSSYDKAPGALLWWHRWLGTGTTVWALICAGASLASPCMEGSPARRRFRGTLLVGAVLVGVSGFLGSALIYGLDHYAWK
jgi:uncharacterized membrane protein/mono/diheme cytochrome c family protein